MDAHRKELPLACCHLALMSCAQDIEQVKYLEALQWGPVDLFQSYALFRVFATKFKACFRISCLVDKTNDTYEVVNHAFLDRRELAPDGKTKIGHVFELLVVKAGPGLLHVLPLANRATLPRSKDRVMELPNPNPVPIVAVPCPGPQQLAIVPANGVAHPAPVVGQPPPGPVNNAPNLAAMAPVPQAPGNLAPQPQPPPPAAPAAPQGMPPEAPWPQSWFRGAPNQYYYEGLLQPADPNWYWVRGWHASVMPPQRCFNRRLEDMFTGVNVALATSDLVRKYLDTVAYVPIDWRLVQPLWTPRDGMLTDGSAVWMTFDHGDVVIADDIEFSVQSFIAHNGSRLLRLVKTRCCDLDVRQTIASTIPLGLVDAALRVEVLRGGPPRVAPESEVISHWMAVVQTSHEPMSTSVLNRLRQNAAAAQYVGTDDPQQAQRYVDGLQLAYPGCREVAGRFGWGYCYSCGLELPGRFKQRLCPGCYKRGNSEVGRLVANGEKVCSQAHFVRYPGVVNTVSRHPPTKPGTETLATEANFRLPHRGMRFSPPLPLSE